MGATTTDVVRPETWLGARSVVRPDGPEWLLFADLVPTQTASLQRDLSGDLRVADAWDARVDDGPALSTFHPYAVDPCAAARFASALRIYATAYATEAFRC